MPLLSTWPAYVDDGGDKTSGTIINKALLDAIKTAILADIAGTTDPLVSPGDTTDEVLAARGSTASLSARLAQVINADGSPAGAAATIAKMHANHVTVGNVGAGTDDLMSYTLPANSLNSNTRGVRVTAKGQFANNANNKQLIFNFGATTVTLHNTTTANVRWAVDVLIGRTGASAETIHITIIYGATAATFRTTAAISTAGTITIKMTAVGVANDDITQDMMVVELY